MTKSVKIILSTIVLILIIWAISASNKDAEMPSSETVKIGFVSPLTGDVAYWGESTVIGATLAKEDLEKEGIDAELIFEDGGLDPKIALTAAQKLISIDTVDAIIAEFNSPAISVSSYLKDKPMLYLYSAAPASPLTDGNHVFKTYLDYESSCRDVANYIKKQKGVEKIGMLKINLEYGDLCLNGLKEVFGGNITVDSYNPGVKDFRSNLSKITAEGIDALVHVSYQPETLASIKQLRDLNSKALFIGLSEIVTPDIIPEYSSNLEGSVMFGLPKISSEFMNRASNNGTRTVGDYNAAALAYIHTQQIARALHACGKDLPCQIEKLEKSKPEPLINFQGFEKHFAQFKTLIQEFNNEQLIEVK